MANKKKTNDIVVSMAHPQNLNPIQQRVEAYKKQILKNVYKEEYETKKNSLLFSANVEIEQNRIRKTFLPIIAKEYLPNDCQGRFSYLHRVRVAHITKWVVDKEENPIDKLSNVYSALSAVDCSIALVYRREQSGSSVYFVITNQSEIIDPAVVDSYFNMFISALCGNFPGVEVEEVTTIGSYNDERDPEEKIEKTGYVIDDWFLPKNSSSIAMITNIASESSENCISQGLEKLLDGIIPHDNDSEYTLFMLAEPITAQELEDSKKEYSEIYRELSPYAEIQTGINYSDANSINGNLILIAGAQNNSSGESVTSTSKNYRVKEALEIIDTHIKRIQQGEARGMWNFAAYVMAGSYSTVQNVSNMYRALTEGEQSYLETEAINIWNANRQEDEKTIETLKRSLRRFVHPEFHLKSLADIINSSALTVNVSPEIIDDPILSYPGTVYGCACITGRELAMAMNMPRAAVSGLPVIECAPFGRDVISQKRYAENGKSKQQFIRLGNIFHMQKEEVNKPVLLDAADLPEHVFVTGSTGAGKSTTIVRMLSEASKLKTDDDKNVTFMVIEPAKGEYKNDVGKMSPDAPVFYFGTNPREKKGNLLRINPFAFPVEQIHILEHLDRLIGIISVCWPLYAAMPAVLKRGMEEAYKACGWDLLQSVNHVHDDIFPTFQDVCTHIRKVIDQSDYSADNRSDYKGALVTRLESLTNGINGLIFSSDPIPDELLFENNVIVDLSRVGSAETKALIMGILVMKLQEYRMAQHETANQKLRHITVLEEAHNLLKRTSTEQHAESGNLLGKSVEMLSNSIAEMRTYGEAFVIADQAPGLLDMSVIRNTNTKIIMRLPDYSDRELVGKAANLNEDQIVEIAKLKPGVAAVYYNGWINPVLCLVKKPEGNPERMPEKLPNDLPDEDKERVFEMALDMLVHRNIPEDVDAFLDRMKQAQFTGEFIYKAICFCRLPDDGRNKLVSSMYYLLFDSEKAIKAVANETDKERFNQRLQNELGLNNISFIDEREKDKIIYCILHEQQIFANLYSGMYLEFGKYYQTKYELGG